MGIHERYPQAFPELQDSDGAPLDDGRGTRGGPGEDVRDMSDPEPGWEPQVAEPSSEEASASDNGSTAMAHQLASTARRPAPAPASGDRTSGGRRRLRRSRSSRPACARWKWFHRPRPPRRPCLGAPVSSLGPATRARAALTRGDNGSNGGQIREYSDEEDPLLARLKRKRERHEAKEAHKGEAAAGGDGGRGHGAAAPRERLTVADMAGE